MNFSCLGNRRLASGAVVTLAKGAVSWPSMMQVVTPSGILEAGYIALQEAVEDSSSFETGSAKFCGTVDEDPTCSSSGRIKHIDVRHDLVRDVCDAGEVRVVCVKTRTSSLSR